MSACVSECVNDNEVLKVLYPAACNAVFHINSIIL